MYELRKMFDSPVPTQRMSGFDGATASAPMLDRGLLVEHRLPRLAEIVGRPHTAATAARVEPPRGAVIGAAITSVVRPLMLVGPMYDQFMALYGEACAIAVWLSQAFRCAV